MDLDVQVRAFVDYARVNGGAAYLRRLRDQALAAVAAGDIEITTTSYEGAAAGGARKFNAQQLLEVVQTALERVEEDAVPTNVSLDFSRRRVTT